MLDIDGDSFVFIITKPQKPKTLIPQELDDINELASIPVPIQPPLGGHVINTLGPRRLLKCEEQKYSYALFGRLSKRKFQSRPLTFYGANSVAIANCTKIMTGTVCIFATHFWIFWIGLHLRDSRNKSPFFSPPPSKKGQENLVGADGKWAREGGKGEGNPVK